MHYIETYLLVKKNGLLVSLVQPKPIVQSDSLLVALARNPMIETALYGHPVKLEIVIRFRS